MVVKFNGFTHRYSNIYTINEIDNRLLKKKVGKYLDLKRNF